MPQSLRRTWLAIGLATLAVLVVGFLACRDLVRDVFVHCPGSLLVVAPFSLGDVKLEPIDFDTAEPPVPSKDAPSFSLRYDQKTDPRGAYAGQTRYSNVRVVWNDVGPDHEPCDCGSVPISLSGEAPYDLRLYKVAPMARAPHYVVKGRDSRTDVRAFFRLATGSAHHHLQSERVLTRRHLSVLVALAALGALVVALLRSRRAMAYALRIHGWTEASLGASGMIETEDGAVLGTLEQSRGRQVHPGPVLVAPEAISGNQLYRDMPIIPRRAVAEGSHGRWAAVTLLRLRDARVLAALSTACTVLAFGARLIA